MVIYNRGSQIQKPNGFEGAREMLEDNILEVGDMILTGLRKVCPHACRLRGKLLRSVRLHTKSDWRRRASLLRLQRRCGGLLGNRGYRRGRCVEGHATDTIHTGRLRLQGRGKDRVDAGLHWLLRLRLEATKARRLRCKALEACLLLLDPKLRLWLEPCGLRHHAVRELVLRHEPGGLGLQIRLESLLVEFGETLSRRSHWRTNLRQSSKLRLQRRWTKRARLLGEVLGCGEGSLGRGRKQRVGAQGLWRRLWPLAGSLLETSGLRAEPLRGILQRLLLLCRLSQLGEEPRSSPCLLRLLRLGRRYCS